MPISEALKKTFEEGQVLLIDKPLHWTSFDIVRKIRNAIKIKKLHNTLNILLCDCACIFPDDPMIWYFRSVLARQNGLNDLALYFIKQASKLSGSSTVYFEVARVYDSLGQSELCARANEQALYKKHVEETTCE